MSKEQIIKDISDYIKKNEGFPKEWYVGISQDARKRLFEDHWVDEMKHLWVYRKADTNKKAREIEDYFLNKVGTDGGPGGGDTSAKTVYVYKKNSHTNP